MLWRASKYVSLAHFGIIAVIRAFCIDLLAYMVWVWFSLTYISLYSVGVVPLFSLYHSCIIISVINKFNCSQILKYESAEENEVC